MDTSGDGMISKAEFTAVLDAAMKKVNKQQPSSLFDQLSKGKDSMSIEDLLAALQNTSHKGHGHHPHSSDAVSGASPQQNMGVMPTTTSSLV